MPYKDPAVKRTYSTWHGMKERCYNINNSNYKDYGAKGVTVCEAWLGSFDSFVADMGYKPTGLSIDRIDNRDGYHLNNCRWATAKEQTANRRLTYVIFCSCGKLLTYAAHHKRPRTICKPCNLASAHRYYRKKKLKWEILK